MRVYCVIFLSRKVREYIKYLISKNKMELKEALHRPAQKVPRHNKKVQRKSRGGNSGEGVSVRAEIREVGRKVFE